MDFVSAEFIVFLAVLLAAYYLLPKRWQWPILLIASIAFFMLDDWRNCIFIGITAATTYTSALWMAQISRHYNTFLSNHKTVLDRQQKKLCKDKMQSQKRTVLLLGLIVNLGILAVTKYTNFIIDNISDLLNHELIRFEDLFIPIAISYYTFQSVSYIIDVYRDKQPAQRNFFKYLLFVCFFPQMVQGPISRYEDLGNQLCAHHSFDGKTFSFGLMRFLWGYFKKMIIADRLVAAVIALANSETYTGAYVLITMLFYAFQLYCDFTGGIDITIGIAQMLRITLVENFNLPYFSKNIREYWNRWHITMGTWFTDYVFYPISVCKPMLKLSKWSRSHFGNAAGKRVTVYLSSLAVWLATGIWHGPAWNFVVWGLANWVVIMVSQELEPLYDKFHGRFHLKGKAPYEMFQVIRTIFLMSAIRLFDVYRNVPTTFRRIFSLFTARNWSALWNGSLLKLGLGIHDYALLAVCLVIVLGVSLVKVKRGSVRSLLYSRKPVFYAIMGVLFLSILIFGAYGIGFDSSGFIYNQF